MGDDDLRRQLAYYKRHLDELAAQRITTEHHQWAQQMQLRQKKQGFQLLSRLALAMSAHGDAGSMFRIAALAINSALDMDRTVIFVPGATPGTWRAEHVAGLAEADVERLKGVAFDLPQELVSAPSLVGPPAVGDSPFVIRLRKAFGVETFICVPIAGDIAPLGLVFSGRLGAVSSLYRALDRNDMDTFLAMSALLRGATLNARLARLEQTERLKSEFYADVAHEFRTPLTLTLGPLGQILAGKWGEVPAPVRQRLEVVERNQERLLGLINEILDLDRLEASAVALHLEVIADANELVSGCVAHFRAAAEAAGVELRMALAPALDGRSLSADRQKLERAVFNLLANALKFTDAGHVEVATVLAGKDVEIVVSDTGIGIAPDELPHVFDRFRMAGSQRRGAGGSGIGLALVKRIAELHHGAVEATSQLGRGTRVAFRLPLRSAVVEHHGSNGAPSPGTSRDARPQSMPAAAADDGVEFANRRSEDRFDKAKPTLLYVEDDADLRAHVHATLEDTYNVFLARDGADGLAKARAYRPDAIITDQRMPRMDGRELLAALRAEPELRATPVVFLTAQHGTQGRIASLAAGADDYLGKPFHEAELRARVANLLRARAHERELADLNRRLSLQVREQMAELVRAGELARFLPRAAVASLRAGGDGARLAPVRRPITVLVTELGTLAALGERLDEPAVAAIVDEYLGAIGTICAARDGVIDGMTGGRLSVLFGVASEADPSDAALAAAHAALEIRQKAGALDADARRRGLSSAPSRGIGVASSACVVGAFGDDLRAFTAIGPATQRATLLRDAASPRAIVLDDATRALLGPLAQTRSLDDDDSGERHELLGLLSPKDPLPVAAPPPASAGHDPRVFRREGDYWTVVYRGRVSRLAASKGATYLSYLLERPHAEVHVLELTGAGGLEMTEARIVSPAEAASLGLSSVRAPREAPLLDDRAKAEYRARLRELEADIAEATAIGDSQRAERASAARSTLAAQLAAALGLGGRDRRSGAAAERVRVNVARTLKTALVRLTRADPILGRHLTASVRTGMFCSYAPPVGVPDDWKVAR